MSTRRAFKRAVVLLGVPRRTIVVSVLAGIGGSLTTFPAAIAVRSSLRSMQQGAGVRRALLLALAGVAIQLLGTFGVAVSQLGVSKKLLERTASLRLRLLRAAMNEATLTIRQTGLDESLQSIVVDTDRAESLVEQALIFGIPGIFFVTSGVSFCLWSDPVFGAACLFGAIPIALLAPLVNRENRTRTVWHYRAVRRTNGRIVGLLELREQIADHGATEAVLEREEPEIENLAKTASAVARTTAAHTQVQLVGLALASCFALSCGVWRVHNGKMGFDSLLACLFALGPTQIGGRLIAVVYPHIVGAEDALDSIDACLLRSSADLKTERSCSTDQKITEIGLSDVTFGFESQPLFQNLSLVARSGERWIITGPNGVGKSTLLRILAGRVAPWSGALLVNGERPSEQGLVEMRKRIAIVPQESGLIEGTVLENIRLFGSVSDEAVILEVLEVVQLRVPLDRHVGPAGIALSGGQRQRLVLARALLHDPDVLLLDEPSTHLDWPLDVLLARVQEYLKGAILFVVTHDHSAIATEKRVVRLDDTPSTIGCASESNKNTRS